MVTISIGLLVGAFRLAGAGSLTPSVAPATTGHDASELYNVLVGTYDSSAVVADKNGDALQVSRCIISKMSGTPCP